MFLMAEAEKIKKDEGDTRDVLCPGGKCASGLFCVADSKIISAGVKFSLTVSTCSYVTADQTVCSASVLHR
jgi:hypothetical protein